MWTLSQKIPTKKDCRWLTVLKFKRRSSWPFLNLGLLCKSQFREKPAFVAAIWANPYKGNPGILFLPIGLRFPIQWKLRSYIPMSTTFTDQWQWLHSDKSGECLLDQPNCNNPESSFVWGWTNQGPRTGTSAYVSQLLSGSKCALSFSTKDWRLHFSDPEVRAKHQR